jgi:hypothetical protein
MEARRAARLNRFKRERLVIDCLNRGVSVREIAVKLGVTEKRMRAIVKQALAANMPGPPEEFAALQISRLNEALLVAYSAMSGMNLKAVDRVVRITRELDRYHGFFPGERRAVRDEREVEAKAEEPRRLLACRLELPPQTLEKPQSAPGDGMTTDCHPHKSEDHPEWPGASAPGNDSAFCSLADPAMTPSALDTTLTARPEMASQALENAQSAAENDTAPNSLNDAFASLVDRAQAPRALDATLTARPEMAPQTLEKPQSAPGDGMTADCHPHKSGDPEWPGASAPGNDSAFCSLADPATTPSALDTTLTARPEMAPQAPENAQSAPENDTAPNSSHDAFASLVDRAQAPSALDATLTARPEMAPQAHEIAQSEPENDTAANSAGDAFGLRLAASAQDLLEAGATQVDHPQMAPQAPEKSQFSPESNEAPASSDEPFLPTLAASAQDPHAHETGSIGPVEISPQNGTGAQSPHPCVAPSQPEPRKHEPVQPAEYQNDRKWSVSLLNPVSTRA